MAVSQRTLGQRVLNGYDPAAIGRYYRYRPLTLIGRMLHITWLLGSFGLRLQRDHWQGRETQRIQQRARELRQILTRLGPSFIKIGQALSTRPDLVRQDFLDELTKLQDELPPFPNEQAWAIIERELGRPVSEAFREISPQPVAAASLGQVYRAVLPDGEVVAVKVQRPNLVAVLSRDLLLLRWGACWLGPWLPLNLGHDLSAIVDELGTKLFEEIDYCNEGRNAEQFAANFHADPHIKVPRVHWPYSSVRVLTLEWIEGHKLTDADRIREAGLDTDALIRIGVIAGLRQLLEHGFFHADPHPGNLFAMPDGRMAYIDFGMMDRLSQHDKETIASAIVHLINQDYYALAEDFTELGFLVPGTDFEPIIPALESVLGDAMGERVRDFNVKTITDRFSAVMYDYPFRVPARFALIIRTLITQEGLALRLNPNFKLVEVAYPYIARRLLRGESPQMRQRLLEVLFKDGKFQWQRLENMLAIARADARFDILPTAQLGLQYLLSEEGSDLRHRLLLALTEDERLHTDEVQRIWHLIQDDLQPSRLLGAALEALAPRPSESSQDIAPSRSG